MMEVFASGLGALSRADRSPPGVPAQWLFGIAHHKLVDAYRRGSADDRARRELGFEPVLLEDDDIIRINELSEDRHIVAMLNRLPRDQREAVRARVLDEQSYEEIARDIGSSSMVVRKRVSRALAQLRSAVEEP
ncbi:MAG: hypothetical protein QOJ29_3345 [Thermoleophilaceae bacterium]|jgi:RNA polymerase sigma-70 factor (ECF subfamily)|nr:hypothetical protein [Thermoleophilaceae bacterium]